MRGLRFFRLCDLLTLLAIFVLVSIVYLCSLPQAAHSLAHRRAGAIETLAAARLALDKEAALIPALVVAADSDSRTLLRDAVTENERRFRQAIDQVMADLPEAGNDVGELSGRFDLVAELGRNAVLTARSASVGEAQNLVRDRFLPALKEVATKAHLIENNLHLQDCANAQATLRPA